MPSRSWLTNAGVTGFEYSAATATGPVRRVNEDSLLAEPPVFLVADGMGGHARGDLASAAAVTVFRSRVVAEMPWTPDAVLDAVRAAHDTIVSVASSSNVSGTTLAGVVLVTVGGASQLVDETTVDPGSSALVAEEHYRWMVVNVGDSRVYQITARGLAQVTVDHTVVQELVTSGVIAPELAREHPERNVITRALGVADGSAPDVQLLPADGACTFVICSDGVSGVLEPHEIADAMSGDIERAAEAVVDRALARGSRDNVTAIVLRSTLLTKHEASFAIAEDTQPRAEQVA